MAEKMDSDRSFSGQSSSSSSDSSTSGSSDADEDAMETIRVLGQTFELPQDLCEDYNLFKEVFSMSTWNILEDSEKQHLKKFLPTFKENDEEEKQKTLKMLFDFEPFKFTSPLSDFYNDLKLGNYRPDLAKMKKQLAKARAKQQKQRLKSYYAKLLPEILLSRERLLAAVKGSPPGPIPLLPLLPQISQKTSSTSVYQRAKRRYFDELNAISSEVGANSSEDENYPEGPGESVEAIKQERLSDTEEDTIFSPLSGGCRSDTYSEPTPSVKDLLAAHKVRRMHREICPELNTNGITLDDIEQRVFGGKIFSRPKSDSPVQKMKRGPKKDSISRGKVSEGKTIKRIKEENDNDVNPGVPNIKYENESDSENSSFVDQMTIPKASKLDIQVQIKQEIMDDADETPSIQMENCGAPHACAPHVCAPLNAVIKEEPPDVVPVQSSGKAHLPIKLEDLDGIDMMALPIQLADEAGEVIQVGTPKEIIPEKPTVEVDESLTETTHANFLSLVRALFPARDAHRASKQQLHARCGAVMKSPIAPLNTWYSQSDDWCAELDSALEFLAGERGTHPDDFVPYLQYMPKTQMYQWIGAGRDCDSILDRLCDRWLRAMSPRVSSKNPPPPKYPTSWTVRSPTGPDVSEFRMQERRRFSSSSKPFTYIQHGYRSVVGPCARAWVSSGCAGTSLLVPDRPRQATFTSLVRDALARLPNGEGTRHDVVTLLKMSQYIALSSEQALLGAVSAVLERFHTAKRDPVVKFDARTAVWTYLHRNRTEEDWMKTTAGRSRGGKAAAAISPNSLPSPTSPPPAPLPQPAITSKPTLKAGPSKSATVVKPNVSVSTPPPLVKTITSISKQNRTPSLSKEKPAEGKEEFIEASDSDVDVDDSNVSTSAPQLSSAQLLMQATLGHPKVSPTPKTKKAIYTPPAKKPYSQKACLAKQNKHAALMSQSVKQAKILAEAVKQASATAQNKANLAAARNLAKQAALLAKASPSQGPVQKIPKSSTPKTVKVPTQSPKLGQSPKQPPAANKQMPASPMQPPPSPKQMPPSPKPPPSPKESRSPKRPLSPKEPPSPKQAVPARQLQSANKPDASAKQPPTPSIDLADLPAPFAQKSLTGKERLTLSGKDVISLSGKEISALAAKELAALSSKELHQTPKQVDIQTVFLPPQSPVHHAPSPKQTQSPKQTPLTPMHPPLSPMQPPQTKQLPSTSKQVPPIIKQLPQNKQPQTKPLSQTAKQPPLIVKQPTESPKRSVPIKPVVSITSIKTISSQPISMPTLSQASATISRSASLPTIIATSHKAPIIRQKTSIKTDAVQTSVAKSLAQQLSTTQTVIHPIINTSVLQSHNKMAPGTRSLLIRPSNVQTAVTATVVTPANQAIGSRKGVVRVLSPANPSTGKSLISPRALLQDTPTTKKRTSTTISPAVTTLAQSASSIATVSSVPNVVTTSVATRTVQLASGRTLQLAANQTVHFPGGQAVQLGPGHTLQLSSLQLPTHSVRLPSGQTVPLATSQVMQALKASKSQTPRVQTTPTIKTLTPSQSVVPVSSVQLAGQTVQFGGQTVQLAGQSVQLTGHTVKLPSGQSVQVASPGVLPTSVQLAGQTFQLASGMQTMQMAGQSVQIPSVPLGSQTVQMGGQAVQLASSPTVQLAGNQTVQLAGSQTVQLPSGQTLQLPSGQTLQLASGMQLSQNAKTLPQVVRSQSQEKSSSQPIPIAKLLTNSQGQMVSLEGVVAGGRIVSGIRPRPAVRVITPATRLTRPVLLASGKPLHNIILQSDGSAVRVTSTSGASTSQTIVISNMAAQTVTTPTTTPMLKLQQVNPIQPIKLSQGIKIQPSSSAVPPSGVRSVVMDGQQLKLVSGRHVLARIVRPNQPPPAPQ